MKSILIGGPNHGQVIEASDSLDVFIVQNEHGERFDYLSQWFNSPTGDRIRFYGRAGVDVKQLDALIRVEGGAITALPQVPRAFPTAQ